jgi:hypothetical protein
MKVVRSSPYAPAVFTPRSRKIRQVINTVYQLISEINWIEIKQIFIITVLHIIMYFYSADQRRQKLLPSSGLGIM